MAPLLNMIGLWWMVVTLNLLPLSQVVEVASNEDLPLEETETFENYREKRSIGLVNDFVKASVRTLRDLNEVVSIKFFRPNQLRNASIPSNSKKHQLNDTDSGPSFRMLPEQLNDSDSGPSFRMLPASSDYNTIVMKLRLAQVMRDNLVNVFGYILNAPHGSIDIDLYVSLMDLYTGLRSRRIKTFEILPSLPKIAFLNPHEQLTSIFRTFNVSVPLYLMGAVSIWLHSLLGKSVDVNSILIPPGEALRVDLLAGIELSLLDNLKRPSVFTQKAIQLAPKNLLTRRGAFFGHIFGAMIEGSLALTRQIVAYIMLATPTYMFIPEVDEAERYLADVLTEDQNSNLDFIVNGLGQREKGDPYTVVYYVLSQLINSKSVDPMIKECAEIVLPHYIAPNYITVNPYYNAYQPIVSSREIDFNRLFKSISVGEYPVDIVNAKDALLVAINRGEINMALILKGFVRFDYTNPHELIIAILDRIKRRSQGTIPDNLVEILHALIVHVKLKYAAKMADTHNYQSFNHFKELFNAFFTPEIPESVKQSARGILNEIQKENIDWKLVLSKIKPSENSRPRHFIKKVLTYLRAKVKNPTTLDSMKFLISSTDRNGDQKDCPKVKCNNNTVEEIPTLPSLGQNLGETTPSPPTPTPSKRFIRDVDIGALFSSIIYLSDDLPDMIKLQTYLSETVSKRLADLNVSNFSLSGELLKTIFNAYINDKGDTNYPEYQLFKKYVNKIQTEGLGARPIPYETSIRIKTIDLNKVLDAIDTNTMAKDGNQNHMEVLYNFLQNEYPLQDYTKGLDFGKFKTRYDFLIGFLQQLISFPGTSPELHESLKIIMKYIQKTGPGAEPLDFTNDVIF